MEWSTKIIAICRHYRLSVSEFALKVGIPKGAALTYTREGALKPPAKPPIDLAPLIFKAFPEVNVHWFLFENGPIVIDVEGKQSKQESNMFDEVQHLNEMALHSKYTQALEELNSVRKELIDCLKGHPDGLTPMRPSTKMHG